MIGRIARFMTRVVSRWLPDPLIFAMLLTLLTFGIALWLTPQTPISMVKFWGDGFWNLLAFGMQMALIIVTGHALASSGPVKSLLRTAASAAKTPAQGVMLVTFLVRWPALLTGDLVWWLGRCSPAKSPVGYRVPIIRY